MADQVITCPKCSARIPLTEAIAQPMREAVQKQLDGEAAQQREALASREKSLREAEEKLVEDRRRQEDELTKKLAAERERVEKEAVKRADERRAVEMRDLQMQIQEKDKKIEESVEKELALRRRERELEDRSKTAELELQRKLDTERKRIEEETMQRASAEFHQKELEAQKRELDMKRTIDEMKRKMEQGSQQMQGEVVELELEGLLKAAFPLDQIEPVAKGVRGADVIQRVINKHGQTCGTIIWETKQTKMWSDGWITKLKDDQRVAKADVAVLLTAALPKGIPNFGYLGDVWITNSACLGGLAAALRAGLEQLAFARATAVGRKEKTEALYNYLMGNEFFQHVRAVVDTSSALKIELDKEKRALARIWAEREKQIERIELGMSSLYGDLKGLGAALPQIDALELDSELSVSTTGNRVALPQPDRAEEENEQLF